MARLVDAAARHESEHQAERQRCQARQPAEQGTPHMTAQRGYGCTRDMQVIEAEAEVIRDCARRLLAGEALHSVTNGLNASGIAAMTARQRSPQSLRGILISGRISGRREYWPGNSYQAGRKPNLGEITATGCWPPIITVEDSDRLRALLCEPRPDPHQYLVRPVPAVRGVQLRPRRGGPDFRGRSRLADAAPDQPGNGAT